MNTISGDGFVDPNNIDSSAPLTQPISDYGYLTDSSRIPSTDFNSATPSSLGFDQQSFYQQNSASQFYSENAEQWGENSTNPDRSPVRESLDARIKNLLCQPRVSIPGLSFLNNIDCTEFNSALNLDKKDLPPKKPMKIDDSEAILGTPPSPFVSASEYLKWHKVTAEIDSGNDPTEQDETQNMANNNDDDDDDDRMSLSSLSSGEKLEDNSLTSAMYPGDHVQMMSRLFANAAAGANPFCSENFNGSLLPQFMYQTFVPQSNSHPFGFFSGFSVPSSFGLPSEIFPDCKDSEQKFVKPTKELLQPLIVQYTKSYGREFREIIIKDVYRKIVENFSFKTFDQWWEDSEKKSKSTEPKYDNIFERFEKSHSYRGTEMFNHLLENRATTITATKVVKSDFSLSRGLRAAMPKMPSFKRKIQKPKSPTHSLDDKLSDISEDESHLERRPARPSSKEERRRVRRRYSVSSRDSRYGKRSRSRSKSSQSSGSSYSSSSASSSSTSSSSSSSSESSSESTSSSESEESDSSSSSAVSKTTSVSRKSSVSSTKSASPVTKRSTQRVQRKPVVVQESDSSTCTADETIEEERKLLEREAENRRLRESFLANSANEKSILEYEASQALISLSSGYSIKETKFEMPDYNNRAAEEQTVVAHLKDHDYCLPLSAMPEEKPKPARSRKVNKENSERKRKKKQNLVDENITPNVPAVASEWRNAKNAKAAVETLNDENKLLQPEIEEPKITFEKRADKMERDILYEFLKVGVDSEDIKYLKRSYDHMIQNESSLWWIHDIHWVDHPPTLVSTPKKKRKLDESVTRIHKTGCARTEGYYKLDSSEKQRYSHVTNAPAEDSNKTIQARQVATAQQTTREARSNQRRLLATFDAALTDLLKFNQLKVSAVFRLLRWLMFFFLSFYSSGRSC